MSGMGWTWLSRLRYDRPGEWSLILWLRQLAALAVAHTGALVLVALSSGWGTSAKNRRCSSASH